MKTKILHPTALFSLIIVLILQSCASPQKMLERGDYDQLIDLAARKLAGKKKKKTEYVLALEEAFDRATREDMARADRLKREGRAENWDRIYDLYRDIDRRQDQIRPLLPLADQHGIRANFRFVRVADLLTEAKEKAATYHYEAAQQYIRQAQETGDRLAAREAYAALERTERYYRNFREKERLQGLALELGRSHILIAVENNAPVVLPLALEEEIRRLSVRDLDNRWQVYYTEYRRDIPFDYKVVLNLQAIDIGPSLVRERQYEESRRVKDGWEYVLDENGNVAKDSLGNDIKEDRYVQVYAEVLETHQQKVARVAGQLEFFDLRENTLLESRPLAAETVFENYAATYRGDHRALSRESRNRIGNEPLPFPTDEGMLFDAVVLLKPAMKREIRRAGMI